MEHHSTYDWGSCSACRFAGYCLRRLNPSALLLGINVESCCVHGDDLRGAVIIQYKYVCEYMFHVVCSYSCRPCYLIQLVFLRLHRYILSPCTLPVWECKWKVKLWFYYLSSSKNLDYKRQLSSSVSRIVNSCTSHFIAVINCNKLPLYIAASRSYFLCKFLLTEHGWTSVGRRRLGPQLAWDMTLYARYIYNVILYT